MWQTLKFIPPRVLTFIKRHSPPRLRLAIRQALGADYRKIPDKIIVVPDGRRFHIGPDLVYWAMSLGLEYEPEASEIVRRILRPGDTVVDVGANVGWYTTLCAGLIGDTGHVYAFEPIPATVGRLKENIALNGLESRVTVVEMAVANSNVAVRTMHLDDRSPALSSLSSLGSDGFTPIPVEVTGLDDFLRNARVKQVDFLKCDVEGGELEVLRGAATLLAGRTAPLVLIELNSATARQFGHTKWDIFDSLQRSGYSRFFEIVDARTLRSVSTRNALESMDLMIAGKDPQLGARLMSSGIRVKT